MNDIRKTRQQMLTEISGLRKRIEQLEGATVRSENSDFQTIKPSRFDSLTGLPERASFFYSLNQVIKTAHQEDDRLAVFFFCLDRFKLINDTLGHSVGDMLLKTVAGRLAGCLSPNDVLCRPGRDEFMMMLTDLRGRDHAALIAEDVFTSLSAPIVLDRHELVMNGSLGICMYPDGSDKAELLIQNAYSALQQAREEGKNTYHFYCPKLSSTEFSRLLLENDLRQALTRAEFSLRYQPQLDIGSGRIIGMEALLRWEHPDLGFISPDEFIPIAEQIGLIGGIGEWVLREACRHHVRCLELGCAPSRTAVNLSPFQLHQEEIASRIFDILKQTGMNPHHLELEITEGALLKDYNLTIATLNELHDLGIQIAVDDFGTGYSSLAYLSMFPISKLKIDKSFVSALTTDQRSETISRAIINLAHSLGMQVIAEGVETQEQLEYLRSHNCNEVQGFLFARPLLPDDSIHFMATATQQTVSGVFPG